MESARRASFVPKKHSQSGLGYLNGDVLIFDRESSFQNPLEKNKNPLTAKENTKASTCCNIVVIFR